MQRAGGGPEVLLEFGRRVVVPVPVVAAVDKVPLQLVTLLHPLVEEVVHPGEGDTELVPPDLGVVQTLLHLLGVVRLSHLHHRTVSLVPEDLDKHYVPVHSDHVEDVVHVGNLVRDV